MRTVPVEEFHEAVRAGRGESMTPADYHEFAAQYTHLGYGDMSKKPTMQEPNIMMYHERTRVVTLDAAHSPEQDVGNGVVWIGGGISEHPMN